MLKNEFIINIVLAADNNFSMPLYVAIYSIIMNIGKDCSAHFYVLDGGLTVKNKKKINNILYFSNSYEKHQITWIDENENSVQDFPLHSGMSRATYLRLFLPEFLPKDLGKVIYLDCDLILETDINELWKINLDEMIVGAARDLIVQTISHSTGVKNYITYGGKKTSPYFNSGVMLIDLNGWQREEVTKKSIEYLIKNKDVISLHEQEALNAALIGKWKELDPRWNQQGVVFWFSVLPETRFTYKIKNMYYELVNNPFVIHYVSKNKPWNYSCMHPLTGRFMYYLKKSRWFSSNEWIIWRFKMYRKRFFWLLKDLKKTLLIISIDNKDTL